MKKALALLLGFCLILTASPLCVWAAESDLTITTNIERDMYYTEDVFTVTLELSNNQSGFSSIRGKLNYDSDNITLISFNSYNSDENEDTTSLTTSYSEHDGYIQLLWTAGPGLVNYSLDGVIAELEFSVNKKADNKTYNFDFEYLDGTRYVYGEDFKDTSWVYIEDVVTENDSFIVDTAIDSMLYFENAPTGAYRNESVAFDIAFSGEDGLYIFKTRLHYDKTAFEFSDIELKNNSLDLNYNLREDDGYVILLFDSNAPYNFNENGVIATVTFNVKADAEFKDTTVSLEYVEAVSVNTDGNVTVENVVFNARSCQFPILENKIPVSLTLHRDNGEAETLTIYKDEKLVLPDTCFADKNWYTDPAAAVDSIYTETVCPGEDLVLYSSACAVDYEGDNFIVPYRFNQQFNVTTDNRTRLLSYTSSESDTARMFRLERVEDNKTYKLSITYKANIENSLGLGLAGATGDNMYVNTSYFEGDQNTCVYNFTTSSDYKTADIYFTASVKGVVSEQSAFDDTKYVNGNGWAYLIVVDDNTNDNDSVDIKAIEITEIDSSIKAGGASVLNEAGFAAAGNKQAIRYFFSYTTAQTENGETILLDGEAYSVVARGFLYRNGAVNKYLDDNSVTKEGMNVTAANSSSDIIIQSKTDNLNACWEYNNENNSLCFSTYVNNYTSDMYSRKLMVRGFVTFCDADGNEFTIYSAPVNRSVSGILSNSVSISDVL